MLSANIPQKSLKRLSVLDDATQSTSTGQKLCPGLLGHVVPSNKFRNDFFVEVASPYIAPELAKKEAVGKDKNFEKRMNQLLANSKARGFGGCCLWEPLFTKKVQGRYLWRPLRLFSSFCKKMFNSQILRV